MKKIFLIAIILSTLFSCKKIVDVKDSNKTLKLSNSNVAQNKGLVLSNDSAFAIVSYAGSGLAGTANGTSGNLLTAQFNAPEGIAFDSHQNMFIADRDNHVIRKITPTGTVSVFAGVLGVTGAQNGPLGTGKFNSPIRIAIDNADNIYVADRDNARIRMVSADGVISTISGTTAGAGSTQFNWPVDVAVNPEGTLVYVADTKNHRIQKISKIGTTWTTTLLAGGPTADYVNGSGSSAKFNYPSGVAIDNAGHIIVADRMNNCIRKVTPTGDVSLLAGVPKLTNPYSLDAPALLAKMGEPFGVTIANNGSIYITDIYFHTIRRLNAEGFLSTVAGSGKSGAVDGDFSSFYLPTSIAIDNTGNFYVADVLNHKIRKMEPTLRTLQYTHGWTRSEPKPGITLYNFVGNRFFSPSTQTNIVQYVNVLDIDLSINHLDFKVVDTLNKTTITNIIGTSSSTVAALSGTYATYMPAPTGTTKNYTSFLRNNNITYWDSNIFRTSSYWVYHEGMFYINSDGTMGMEASDMTQNPFSPTLRKYMMSGAPLLIANNAIIEKPTSPVWSSASLQQSIRESTASRSVIAIPATNNHILLVVAEGRVTGASYCAPLPRGLGMTTSDIAQFMKRYFNVKGALNLDGGGSASMHLKDYGNNGGIAGGIGVFSNPALGSSAGCPIEHTNYANQRSYMQDAIAVIPN